MPYLPPMAATPLRVLRTALVLGLAWASVASAELAGTLRYPRANHTATLLPDGKVALIGGFGSQNYSVIGTTELYDRATRTTTDGASLLRPRAHHTATVLQDGRILIVGGESEEFDPCEPEIYDPATGQFTGAAHFPRGVGHSTTLLADGRVLVVGGTVFGMVTSHARIYNPATDSWTVTSPLPNPRHLHNAVLLADGRVLVTGGTDEFGFDYEQALIWNPATGMWTHTGSMWQSRALAHSARLPDGRVMTMMGFGVEDYPAEIYSPDNAEWDLAPGPPEWLFLGTSLVLPDGKFAHCGGSDGDYLLSTKVHVYDPATNIWGRKEPLVHGRLQPALVAYPDGTILATGGYQIIYEDDGNDTLIFPEEAELLIKDHFQLIIQDVPDGSVSGNEGYYADGSIATIHALPSPGHMLLSWEGDASGSDNPLLLTMDRHKFIDPNFGPDLRDPDQDGVSTYDEVQIQGTDPDNPDTDGDGLNDGIEVNGETDALDPDSDDDGLSDGAEVNEHHSDPMKTDSDDDGFDDGYEVAHGFSPAAADSTPDGIMTIHPAVEVYIIGATHSVWRIEGFEPESGWSVITPALNGAGREAGYLFSLGSVGIQSYRAIKN